MGNFFSAQSQDMEVLDEAGHARKLKRNQKRRERAKRRELAKAVSVKSPVAASSLPLSPAASQYSPVSDPATPSSSQGANSPVSDPGSAAGPVSLTAVPAPAVFKVKPVLPTVFHSYLTEFQAIASKQLLLIKAFEKHLLESALPEVDKNYFKNQCVLHRQAVQDASKKLSQFLEVPVNLSGLASASFVSSGDASRDAYAVAMAWNLKLNHFAKQLNEKTAALPDEKKVKVASLYQALQADYFLPAPASLPTWYSPELAESFDLYLVGAEVLDRALYYWRSEPDRAWPKLSLKDEFSDTDYQLLAKSPMDFLKMFAAGRSLADISKEQPFNVDEAWICYKKLTEGSKICDVTASNQTVLASVYARKMFITAALHHLSTGKLVLPHEALRAVFGRVISLELIQVKSSPAELSGDDIAFMLKNLAKLKVADNGILFYVPKVFRDVMQHKKEYWPVLQLGLSLLFKKYFSQRPPQAIHALFQRYKLIPFIIKQTLGKVVSSRDELDDSQKAFLQSIKTAYEYMDFVLKAHGLNDAEIATVCKDLKIYMPIQLKPEEAYAFNRVAKKLTNEITATP